GQAGVISYKGESRVRFVFKRRGLMAAALIAFALLGVRLGASAFGHSSTAVHSAVAKSAQTSKLLRDEPGGDAGQLESYWGQRVTYPTGNFNPAWVRNAAKEDSQIKSGIPTGKVQPFAARTRAAQSTATTALSTTSFTPLGPQPEHMTGCNG